MRYLLVFSFLMLSFFALPQEWNGSAYSDAMCGSVSCATGFNSIGGNPAGAAFSPLGVGIGYCNRYGLSELSQKSAKGAVPVLGGAFFSCFDYYGFSLFSESHASLGFSRKLSDCMAAGIDLNYYQVHVADHPTNARAFTGSIGFIGRPADKFTIASYVTNITNSQYSGNDTIIPFRIITGISRTFYGGHSVELCFEKSSLHDPIIIRGGAVVRIMRGISLLAGCSTYPFTMGMGAEFAIRGVRLQFSARRNEFLGWIQSASVCYVLHNDRGWKNNDENIE